MNDTNTEAGQNGKKRNKLQLLVRLTDMSYSSLVLLWLLLAIMFAFAYFLLETYLPAHAPQELSGLNPWPRFLNALYFSIITATSTGYGDIVPMGISKALASIQSISALLVFAICVTKLVSQRQDLAIREVHRLTFEDIFHNTRGDLFTVRKDLDIIIDEARLASDMNEENWENLIVCFQQAQSLISEIPEFYNDGDDLYTIDPKREKLLMEAVFRTLQRMLKTLDVLDKSGIECRKNEQCLMELHELINVVERVVPLWQEHSPYQKAGAFAGIIDVKNEMKNMIDAV